MEDQVQRTRLRFKSMLETAEQAAEWAARDRPGVLDRAGLMLAATKAMNRAGGFLEAVIIVVPGLGVELLEEFETFASKVDHHVAGVAEDPPERWKSSVIVSTRTGLPSRRTQSEEESASGRNRFR